MEGTRARGGSRLCRSNDIGLTRTGGSLLYAERTKKAQGVIKPVFLFHHGVTRPKKTARNSGAARRLLEPCRSIAC